MDRPNGHIGTDRLTSNDLGSNGSRNGCGSAPGREKMSRPALPVKNAARCTGSAQIGRSSLAFGLTAHRANRGPELRSPKGALPAQDTKERLRQFLDLRQGKDALSRHHHDEARVTEKILDRARSAEGRGILGPAKCLPRPVRWISV